MSFHSHRLETIRNRFPRSKAELFAKGKRFFLRFFTGSSVLVMLYAFINPPFTPLMVIRSIGKIAHRESPLREHKRVPIKDISPSAIYAVIGAEDNKFATHFGFDIDAIQNAIEYNIEHKSSTIGGSTISQQTAKNVFLWPGRDIIRKGFETYFTLLIELLRGKERIVEVYLNVIEFGDGIYGIEAASQHYFHTSAKRITSYQAALLAAILPNPRYYEDHLYTYQIQRRKAAISNNIRRAKRTKQTKNFVKSLKE